MDHFCTYFDHRYLPRALALRESLLRHQGPQVQFHALCLSEQALATLTSLKLPGVHPIALSELEAADPQLPATKPHRTPVEYYFTCTASLTRYVLDKLSPGQVLAYVDADLYFFADSRAIDRDMADDSVYVIEHRYPPSIKERYEPYGRFNVGLVAFRHDRAGWDCLNDWRQRCLDWCHERLEPDRYADQKYLDAWPRRFAKVKISTLAGANLAPWNLAGHAITRQNGQVMADADPLIFYHFHRLKIVSPHLFDIGLEHYGAAADRCVVRDIYAPYLKHLRRIMRRCRAIDGQRENLRLDANQAIESPLGRSLRQAIYQHPLLALGPIVTPVHLEPWVRPLLSLRQAWIARHAA